jgi:hypothetical protein
MAARLEHGQHENSSTPSADQVKKDYIKIKLH